MKELLNTIFGKNKNVDGCTVVCEVKGLTEAQAKELHELLHKTAEEYLESLED